jgi:hypothetical protein
MDCILIYEDDIKPVQLLLTFACLFEALLIHIQELAGTKFGLETGLLTGFLWFFYLFQTNTGKVN